MVVNSNNSEAALARITHFVAVLLLTCALPATGAPETAPDDWLGFFHVSRDVSFLFYHPPTWQSAKVNDSYLVGVAETAAGTTPNRKCVVALATLPRPVTDRKQAAELFDRRALQLGLGDANIKAMKAFPDDSALGAWVEYESVVDGQRKRAIAHMALISQTQVVHLSCMVSMPKTTSDTDLLVAYGKAQIGEFSTLAASLRVNGKAILANPARHNAT